MSIHFIFSVTNFVILTDGAVSSAFSWKQTSVTSSIPSSEKQILSVGQFPYFLLQLSFVALLHGVLLLQRVLSVH